MELSNSNIKKSYYISRNGTLHFLRPSPKKNQKNSPEKSSLYFRKWNFLALMLKNSYIYKNGTLHFPAQSQTPPK